MNVHIKARWIDETGEVVKSEYTDGQLALLLMEGKQPLAKLSVNLIGHGMICPSEHVFVPDYSENEGLPAELERLGICERVQDVTFGPYDTQAVLMKVLV